VFDLCGGFSYLIVVFVVEGILMVRGVELIYCGYE